MSIHSKRAHYSNLSQPATAQYSIEEDPFSVSPVTGPPTPPAGEIADIAAGSDVPASSSGPLGEEDDAIDMATLSRATAHGLRISVGKLPTVRLSRIPRVPVGTKSSLAPKSTDRLISPSVSRHHSRETSFTTNDTLSYLSPEISHPEGQSSQSTPHLTSLLPDPSPRPEDDVNATLWAGKSSEAEGRRGCASRRDIYRRKHDWLSGTVLALSFFSTVFSGVYWIIALVAPSYGTRIGSNGAMTLSTANFLAAVFAKMIELSFVTVFVTLLGQALSRRAFVKESRGINLAELTMRSWILQPGTLITNYQDVRYAAFTFLGIVSLIAALISMLYTTAADTLVAPKLRYTSPELIKLFGQVSATYANPPYIASRCATPIRSYRGEDPDANSSVDEVAGLTCLQIQHAGQSFHNFALYMANWTQPGIGEKKPSSRVRPPGMLYDNTTVLGSWIDIHDFSETSSRFNRRTHNVTLAMPHAGVFSAALDPINSKHILRPQDLGGLGGYVITASVPSPAVNVICAGLTEQELKPFVFTMWDHGGNTYDNALGGSNHSAVDDVFDFGETSGRKLPTFEQTPIAYNTILNTTMPYMDGSIYLLGLAPPINQTTNISHPFELCSLRSILTPTCSTWYRASASGSSMRADCEEPSNPMAYGRLVPEATSGVVEKDWANIASEWGRSLSLNAGVSNGAASSARLLTEFIPRASSPYELNPSIPSSAEALAVLAGNTLLLSSIDSPFIHFWNYSNESTLNPPQYQSFRATLQSQQYASGGNLPWQKSFHLILFLVFGTNVFCLAYFIIRRGHVTDFTEPQNLFSLCVNSPPSQRLAGSCGGGPEKHQFGVNWFINVDQDDHVYIEDETELASYRPLPDVPRSGASLAEMEVDGSPLRRSYVELSRKRQSIL